MARCTKADGSQNSARAEHRDMFMIAIVQLASRSLGMCSRTAVALASRASAPGAASRLVVRYLGLEIRDWVKRYRATAGAPCATPPSTASRPCRSQALQAHKHCPVEAVTVTTFESREGCGVAPRGPRYRTSMTATPPARSSRQAACTRARTPTADTSGQRSQPPPHSAPPRPAAWTSASVRLRSDHGRAADAYGPSQGGRFHRRSCAPTRRWYCTRSSPPSVHQ